MKEALRKELIAIVLEECFSYNETFARRLAEDKVLISDARERLQAIRWQEDHWAAVSAVNRIDARCSTIKG